MTKLRQGDAWMPAPEYGKSLRGLTINLVVDAIEPCLPFHLEVLGAELVYADPDIAVFAHGLAEWMLHARHTYNDHPLIGRMSSSGNSRVYPELRLHGQDPDSAEENARRLGYEVLASTADKPHGLREVYIFDGSGYLWVPDVPVKP